MLSTIDLVLTSLDLLFFLGKYYFAFYKTSCFKRRSTVLRPPIQLGFLAEMNDCDVSFVTFTTASFIDIKQVGVIKVEQNIKSQWKFRV